jgi:hypothetical protein
MARARVLVAAVLAASSFAVLAAPASASAPAKNTKFCNAVAKIGKESSSLPYGKQAKALAKQFRNAGKSAPTKVKNAMNKIASFLSSLGGASSPQDVAKSYAQSSYKQYVNAISTYATYAANECVGS